MAVTTTVMEPGQAEMSGKPAVIARGVRKVFGEGETRVEALRGIDLYVGDGATIVRSMVRMRDHALIGHAPITAQLGWCEEEAVTRAIFTHCGSGIVKGSTRRMAARVRELGKVHGVEASIAYDGLCLSL